MSHISICPFLPLYAHWAWTPEYACSHRAPVSALVAPRSQRDTLRRYPSPSQPPLSIFSKTQFCSRFNWDKQVKLDKSERAEQITSGMDRYRHKCPLKVSIRKRKKEIFCYAKIPQFALISIPKLQMMKNYETFVSFVHLLSSTPWALKY